MENTQEQDEKKPTESPSENPPVVAPEASSEVREERGQHRGGYQRNQGGGSGQRRRGRKKREEKPKEEFESTIVDLARVTRVMAGGKRMSFRACVVLGDKKGRVGMGVQKGADVQLAVQKATHQAKKNIIHIPIVEGTIPHTLEKRFKSAHILLKPAKPGTGLIAGGSVRVVLELAGVKDVVAKMKGSSNKLTNVAGVISLLKDLRTKEDIARMKSPM